MMASAMKVALSSVAFSPIKPMRQALQDSFIHGYADR
jgi:hypothetical protein